jgi:hypothetical protein
VIFGQQWLNDFGAQRFHCGQRASLVSLDKSRITNNVDGEDCNQPPLGMIYSHGHPLQQGEESLANGSFSRREHSPFFRPTEFYSRFLVSASGAIWVIVFDLAKLFG